MRSLQPTQAAASIVVEEPASRPKATEKFAIADRSQDERLLAEAQAAFAANNPFAYFQPAVVGQAAGMP